MSKLFEGAGALALLGSAGASDTGASVTVVLIGVAVAALLIGFGVIVGNAQKKIRSTLQR